jgi:hypothetical protein
MDDIRHFLRDFTASAVKEHLRSQIEDRVGPPDLTKNEIELVRFIREGSFRLGRAPGRGFRLLTELVEGIRRSRRASDGASMESAIRSRLSRTRSVGRGFVPR